MNDTDEYLTRPRPGSLSAHEWEWSVFQIQIAPETSPWNLKSKVNFSVLMHICIFSCSGLSVASSGWQWSAGRLQWLFSWADNYCYNYIRISARLLSACKHHLWNTRPSKPFLDVKYISSAWAGTISEMWGCKKRYNKKETSNNQHK